MTEEVNKGAKFFLFSWNDNAVAIVAVLNTPRKGVPNGMAISRVVVLPDYQGMGLGSKICEFIGRIFINDGKRMYIKTVNPALGEYFNRSENWRGTSMNGKVRTIGGADSEKYRNRLTRASYCHEYIGEPLSGYEELLLPIKKMRDEQRKRTSKGVL